MNLEYMCGFSFLKERKYVISTFWIVKMNKNSSSGDSSQAGHVV